MAINWDNVRFVGDEAEENRQKPQPKTGTIDWNKVWYIPQMIETEEKEKAEAKKRAKTLEPREVVSEISGPVFYTGDRPLATSQPEYVKSMTAQEALAQGRPNLQEQIDFARRVGIIEREPVPLSMNIGDNATVGGYLLNRAVSGLVGTTEGLDATRKLLNPQPEIPGMPQMPEEAIQQSLEEQRLRDRIRTAEAGEEKSPFVQFLGNKAEQIAQQVPTALLGAASGGVMGVPFVMTQAAGSSYEQARSEGASHEQALKYGIANALLEGAVEAAVGGIPGTKGFADPLIDAATRNVKNRLLQSVARRGLDALGEGVEEGLSALIEPLIRRGTYDDDAKVSMQEVLNNIWEGFTTAAIMQAPSAIVDIKGLRQPTVSEISYDTEQANPIQKAVQNIQQEIETEAQRLASLNAETIETPITPIGGEPISQSLELPDLPVRYNPNLKNEASNKGDHIEVGDKFYQLSPEQQETILVHENAHNIADEYLFKQGHFEEIMNNKAFGETKTAPNGRTYWEGIFGDVGANSVVETFTEAIAVYKENPQWLQERHPQAYEYIKNNVVEGLSTQQGFTPIGGEYAAASIETPRLTATPTEQTQQARIFGEPVIPEGERERGVSQNIRTDIGSPEGLRQSLTEEPLTYTQKSNIETKSRAEQIMALGYEEARARLDEMLDRMDTEAAPLAVMLAREAWNRGDKQGARQIIAHAAEKATQAGQFGQAFRILRDSDPASLLTSFQNQVKKLNEEGRKQYGKRWVDVELTDTEIELIMNTPLESEAELQELQQIIGQRIANELPSDAMEKFNAWRRIAMLFNPKTHIRNIGGNILMSGLQSTSDIVATGLEKIFVPKDQRTKALFWKNDQNLVKMVNETWEVEKNSIENISRYDISNLRALGFDKRVFQSDILQALNDITMQGLNLADVPFVKAAYTNSLGQFMKARGLTEVTQEAKDYAKRRALEATFKETNEMATILNRLKQKPVIGTLVEGAVPFTKTPANITMRAIDYSPGGILKALYDIKAGKTAAQVIEDLSKGLTGTAVMALGMWLRKIGWARVERDKSDKAEGLYQLLGRQTFSIITPFGSYTFDWAQPAAVPLATGIAVAEAMSKRKDGESLMNALLEGLYAGGDTIFNMTMLKNIKDIFGSGGSPTKKISSIPIAYIEQAIPSVFGQIARVVDPVRRSTYDPDPMKQEWNKIKARIPFLSGTLNPYLDIWGNEQYQGGILQQFISPGYFAAPTDDPVTLEVARLYDAFKDNNMLPKVAPAKFSHNNQEYILTSDERTQFQRIMGQENYNDIARLISSDEYRQMTDEQKVKRIKKIINDNYDDAKKAIIGGRLDQQ